MNRCPGCGLESTGGAAGCQSRFHELTARDFSDYRYGRFHRMAVDTYCVQHPEQYCVSAKSLVAHLGGLYCAFEQGADPEIYRALQRLLNGKPALEKPALPSSRGEVTIADVLSAPDPDSYGREVKRWARSVWDAHAPVHPFVRRWLQDAMEKQSLR